MAERVSALKNQDDPDPDPDLDPDNSRTAAGQTVTTGAEIFYMWWMELGFYVVSQFV